MVVGTLIFVEGCSSLVLFGFAVSRRSVAQEPDAPSEHAWTQYDRFLGWVSVPNLTVPDMFGPGVFLHTNGQGFRGSRAYGVTVPAGKIRVICSGDSFTFGFGVDDNHTWCQLLASLDPRIEPVNMAQSAYGIDQAYLWYKRDGNVLQHDVLIFAFITDDFYRMESLEYFSSYPKPILDVDRGQLVVKNVPVPRRRSYLHGPALSTAALGTAVRQLKAYELETKVLQRLTSRRHDTHEHTWEVAVKVFESLQEMCAAKKSALVLVQLPTAQDILTWTQQDSYWREPLAAESKKRGWIYIDLIPELRRLPAEQSETFFKYNGPGSRHYSDAGNQWVAHRLYAQIAALPRFGSMGLQPETGR